MHPKCTQIAPKVHPKCTKSAPKLHSRHIQKARKTNTNRIKTAPKAHQKYTKSAPKTHPKCTQSALKRAQSNCSTLLQKFEKKEEQTSKKTIARVYTKNWSKNSQELQNNGAKIKSTWFVNIFKASYVASFFEIQEKKLFMQVALLYFHEEQICFFF